MPTYLPFSQATFSIQNDLIGTKSSTKSRSNFLRAVMPTYLPFSQATFSIQNDLIGTKSSTHAAL